MCLEYLFSLALQRNALHGHGDGCKRNGTYQRIKIVRNVAVKD